MTLEQHRFEHPRYPTWITFDPTDANNQYLANYKT